MAALWIILALSVGACVAISCAEPPDEPADDERERYRRRAERRAEEDLVAFRRGAGEGE